jgi:hypothetical protein
MGPLIDPITTCTISRPMAKHRRCRTVFDTRRRTRKTARSPAMPKTCSPTSLSALRNMSALMRVTASIHGRQHIALKVGTNPTHQVGESSADGTIAANPRTAEAPGNTRN